MDPIYIAVGLGVGLMVGLTGIGGGALLTPILVLGFGVPPAIAVGTDLIYAFLTKLSAVGAYARRGAVRWDVVGRLAAGSVPGALVTVAALHGFAPDAMAASGAIKVGLGCAVMLSALLLLFRSKLQAFGHRWLRRGGHHRGATVAAGFVLGGLVALTSVGAGTLGTAALIVLYPMLAVPQIVGTEIAHAVVLTAVAGAGHLSQGNVDWTLLGALLVGSLPGAWIGSHLGLRLPERFVRPALAGTLFVLGGKLVF